MPRCEKTFICICEDKGADELRGYLTADQHICFRYMYIHLDSKIPLLTISCCWTAWFVSDLVGNSKDIVSRDGAHILSPAFEKFECYILL